MGQVNVNPGGSSSGGSGAVAGMSLGLIVGIILILVLLLVGYFLVWPMFSTGTPAPGVDVNVRTP